MGNWGISETASEKEKIKSEFADFIGGLNSCGEIDYSIYSELFDFTMQLLDKMFEHGKGLRK
jgi:nitrate reductase assembly molybdenum cofactor insertion protein NarJ